MDATGPVIEDVYPLSPAQQGTLTRCLDETATGIRQVVYSAGALDPHVYNAQDDVNRQVQQAEAAITAGAKAIS
jgi:hypothetical protein